MGIAGQTKAALGCNGEWHCHDFRAIASSPRMRQNTDFFCYFGQTVIKRIRNGNFPPDTDRIKDLFYLYYAYYNRHMIEIIQSDAFRNWLLKLKDRRAAGLIVETLTRLAAGHFGNVKPLGHGLYEAKIKHDPGYRLYYIRKGEITVILLCGDDKSTHASDIENAYRLAEDWENEYKQAERGIFCIQGRRLPDR